VEAQRKASTGGLSSGATGPEWVQLGQRAGRKWKQETRHDGAEPGLGGAASRTTDQRSPALLPFAPQSSCPTTLLGINFESTTATRDLSSKQVLGPLNEQGCTGAQPNNDFCQSLERSQEPRKTRKG
jgi:hypothetical protein